MVKPHLISTSAHVENSERISRYIDSYKYISYYGYLFQSVSILETVSKSEVNYLENTGFNVYYSDLKNDHWNKGVNWIRHLSYFLSKSKLKDDDIIIFITGRYNILNANIFSLIEKHMIQEKNDLIAKDDRAVFSGDADGVHTFYMAFTKSKFLDLSNWFEENADKNKCIEWEVKRYMICHEKCLILSKNTIMGVQLVMGADLIDSESIKHLC